MIRIRRCGLRSLGLQAILAVGVCTLTRPQAVRAQTAVRSMPAAAQAPVAITRLASPVRFDGLSNEPAWQQIAPLPATVHIPNFDAAPSERTEFRIAYDDDYLYVAGRLYDSEPEGIRGISLKRDESSTASDFFIILLDTFNDKENSLGFATTPTGSRTDMALSIDGDRLNFTWNTFWDAAVRRTEEGWFAELRIPFSSLRFQERDGRVVMGATVIRVIARKNEVITWPAIAPEQGFTAIFQPSEAAEIVLEGVRSRRPVYVRPYLLGGGGSSYVLNAAETGYEQVNEPEYQAGLDLKYGLTSNLTLDVTLNPDFAQVEADDEQVNLTRFSLFFPEKRLFFQERASVFDFSLGNRDRLFYSRRIGLSEGQKVRIYGGARVVGRVGEWDVGILDMQTAGSKFLPSENLSAVRLRRRVVNENSYVGGMLTSRLGLDGSYNLAYGLDGILRLFGDDYLTLAWAQTFDRDDAVTLTPFERGHLRFQWARRGSDGLTYTVSARRAGAAFAPGLGFVRRSVYSRIGDRVAYGWRPGPESDVLLQILSLNGFAYFRNVDGSVESAALGPRWRLDTKSRHQLRVWATMRYEDVKDSFQLSDNAEVVAGPYRFYSGRISYQPPFSNIARAGVTLEAGSFYDGWNVSLGVTPSWRASRHFELTGVYRFDRVSFPDRGQRFTAHVARLRALVMLDHRWSASTFVQYNSAADIAVVNARLRYNPREGNDLYVVYNHGLNTHRFGSVPALPLTDARTVLVKYSHTFDLAF